MESVEDFILNLIELNYVRLFWSHYWIEPPHLAPSHNLFTRFNSIMASMMGLNVESCSCAHQRSLNINGTIIRLKYCKISLWFHLNFLCLDVHVNKIAVKFESCSNEDFQKSDFALKFELKYSTVMFWIRTNDGQFSRLIFAI